MRTSYKALIAGAALATIGTAAHAQFPFEIFGSPGYAGPDTATLYEYPNVQGRSVVVTREPGGASDAALAGGTSGTNGSKSADAGATVSSGPRQVTSRPAEPVDLLGTAGSPVVKRLIPALVGALVAFLIGRKLRRRRSA